jgi:hypothetical protein
LAIRSNKYTFEYVKQYFEDHGCVLLSEEYVGVHERMEYICNCGDKAPTTFHRFKSGKRCKKCGIKKRANSKKHSYEFVVKFFRDNDCVLLESEYVDSNTSMNYLCSCGEPSTIAFQNFKNGQRCKDCGIKKRANTQRKYSYQEVVEIFNQRGCVLLETEYVNANTQMNFICSCGNPGRTNIYDFENGSDCRKCSFKKISGTNSPNYKHDKTLEEREIERNYPEYRNWRTLVFERDEYTCQCCKKKKGGQLVSHHIDGYHWCVERRTDISNGITLCKFCHDVQYEGSFHYVYGNKNNTKAQYNEWISSKRNQDAI